MLTAFVLGCAVFVAVDDSASGDKPDGLLTAYREAAAKARHNADAEVRLALWCEEHGLATERVKHLTLAILTNPNHVTARGLLGLVSVGGKWKKATDTVAELAGPSQTTLQEYLKRRIDTPNKSDAQFQLARWCEQNNLNDQAIAHYSVVVRLDPKREAAWKKLGYEKSNGGWFRPDQLAAMKIEAEHQKQATQKWKPRLAKARLGLSSSDPARQGAAEAILIEATDPRAVPAVWETFASGDEQSQLVALRVLGRIDGPVASRAIVQIALTSSSPTVRGRAIETVKRRDPRDFMDILLGMIHKPYKYQVRPINGFGSEGALFVDGERFNIDHRTQVAPLDPRMFMDPSLVIDPMILGRFSNDLRAESLRNATGVLLSPTSPSNPDDLAKIPAPLRGAFENASKSATLDYAYGVAAFEEQVNRQQAFAEAQNRLQIAQQSLADQIRTVEGWNEEIQSMNDRVQPLAKAATGKDFGADPDAWKSWWINELGYSYTSPTDEKPTYTDVAYTPIDYSPITVIDLHPAHNCFAAGTLVRTIDGPRAIEQIQIGDRVLSQNPRTGELSFKAVLLTHHNSPSPTLTLKFGEETVIATGIHRFWLMGSGWKLARDLEPGDVVRVIGGTATIDSVSNDRVQPVFNLDVAENRNFFVGGRGYLVHDFGMVQPVAERFDQSRDATKPPVAAR